MLILSCVMRWIKYRLMTGCDSSVTIGLLAFYTSRRADVSLTVWHRNDLTHQDYTIGVLCRLARSLSPELNPNGHQFSSLELLYSPMLQSFADVEI